MALFDLDTVGTIGTPKWEYSNGSSWTEFFPGYAEQRYNDSGELAGQDPYAFDTDGGELILEHTVKNWVWIITIS